MSITFFGISKTLKIHQSPSGDQMKLDGITYRRKGGFSTSSTTTSSNGTTLTSYAPTSLNRNRSADAPSDSEVESLVKDSLGDFTDAVDKGDFTDLRITTSRDF